MHSPAYSTVTPFYFTYISYTCICTPRPSAHIHLPYPLALTVCIPRFSSTSCQFPTFCLSTPSTSPTLNLVYLHVILPCPLPCLPLCFFLLHSSSSHHIPWSYLSVPLLTCTVHIVFTSLKNGHFPFPVILAYNTVSTLYTLDPSSSYTPPDYSRWHN